MKSVPCVGCGVVSHFGRPRWSKTKPLCPGCKKKLVEYDELLASIQKMEQEVFSVPTSNDIHNWMNINTCRRIGITRFHHHNEGQKALRDTILKILSFFPEIPISACKGDIRELLGRGFDNTFRLFPAGFPGALLDLIRAFALIAKLEREDGLRDGSNLLRELMDGSVTNEEINERMRENKG